MDQNLEQIKTYVILNLKRGYSKDQVTHALLSAGWKSDLVNTVFASLVQNNIQIVQGHTLVNKRNLIVIKMWLFSALVALILFLIFNIYGYFWKGTFSLLTLSVGFAGAGAICIGLSFALSAISYYFDFLDHEIAYRKNLGLIGYFLALIYSVMLLFINPERYYYGFFENLISFDFILGLGAMTILTFMALISNGFAMRKIGVIRWRHLLRFGYVAYLMLIIRAIVIEGESWVLWFKILDNLPPPRLLVSIFASMVIGLRVSMEISMRKKNKEAKLDLAGEPEKQ